MGQYQCGAKRKQKWYNANIFPLIPVVEIRKKDECNPSGFTFRWLFLTTWSLDTPGIEVSIVACPHWGVGVIGVLPYLRWVFTIPCPSKVSEWIHTKLNRCNF